MGTDDETGDDLYAVQVAPASHWPEMRAAILVVSDKKCQQHCQDANYS